MIALIIIIMMVTMILLMLLTLMIMSIHILIVIMMIIVVEISKRLSFVLDFKHLFVFPHFHIDSYAYFLKLSKYHT